jgi:hypothetical protein
MSDKRRAVAIHEAGHAVVARKLIGGRVDVSVDQRRRLLLTRISEG